MPSTSTIHYPVKQKWNEYSATSKIKPDAKVTVTEEDGVYSISVPYFAFKRGSGKQISWTVIRDGTVTIPEKSLDAKNDIAKVLVDYANSCYESDGSLRSNLKATFFSFPGRSGLYEKLIDFLLILDPTEKKELVKFREEKLLENKNADTFKEFTQTIERIVTKVSLLHFIRAVMSFFNVYPLSEHGRSNFGLLLKDCVCRYAVNKSNTEMLSYERIKEIIWWATRVYENSPPPIIVNGELELQEINNKADEKTADDWFKEDLVAENIQKLNSFLHP